MNYRVKIIDERDDTHLTRDERAIASSVVLDWKGGDRKDELFIVGSALSFTMAGMSLEDGQYLDLFTGDETRYRVILEQEDGVIVWQGFLLPDSYSEPYSNSPILVDFEATDGLGRLKGKYLPEDFYEEEKSVIQIIAQCLKLTGVNLSFRFSPAIENKEQKDYDLIYLDTSRFKDGEKKQDAYKIIDDLLKSMLCTLYQADNYYNIEGLNVRNFQVYEAKVYSPSGILTDTVEITRLKKFVTALKPTDLTSQPPYGIINVSHKRGPVSLSETLVTEKNDGWVQYVGVEDGIYATDWFPRGLQATAYQTQVGFNRTVASDTYATLKKRPYIRKGQKFKLTLGFELELIHDLSSAEKEALTDNWRNAFVFDMYVWFEENGGTYKRKLLWNVPGFFTETEGQEIEIVFDEDLQFEQEFQFISNYSGELGIDIYSARDTVEQRTYINRVNITALSLEEIGFQDEYRVEILSNDEYTLKKEINLVYADDVDDYSTAFRLQKLNLKGELFNEVEIPVITQRNIEGYWHIITNLRYANLVKDNIEDVLLDGNPLPIHEVIYNYNNSQDHHIVLESQVPEGGVIAVREYSLNQNLSNRDHWLEWTDVRYGMERKRYPRVVAEIIERLHRKPIFKIDYQVKNNVKFNDLLDFSFVGEREFMLSNCRWDIDGGYSTVVGLESFYDVAQGENIPPIVEAGPDQYIGTDSVGLTCEAYDPDGFIVSYHWEEITGKNVSYSRGQNTNSTTAFNLTEDYYEFRITVTDNDGATASDIVKVYRLQTTELDMQLIDEGYDAGGQKYYHYQLGFNPEIKEGSEVNVHGMLLVEARNAFGQINLLQDGINKASCRVQTDITTEEENLQSKTVEFSINYFPGSEVLFYVVLDPDDGISSYTAYAKITVDRAEFVKGSGTVGGLSWIKEHEE